jgi:hypothetical protein
MVMTMSAFRATSLPEAQAFPPASTSASGTPDRLNR